MTSGHLIDWPLTSLGTRCTSRAKRRPHEQVFTLTSFPWQLLFARVDGKKWQVFPWQVSLLKSWHANSIPSPCYRIFFFVLSFVLFVFDKLGVGHIWTCNILLSWYDICARKRTSVGQENVLLAQAEIFTSNSYRYSGYQQPSRLISPEVYSSGGRCPFNQYDTLLHYAIKVVHTPQFISEVSLDVPTWGTEAFVNVVLQIYILYFCKFL